jgi:malate dehydrogenase (quinone)
MAASYSQGRGPRAHPSCADAWPRLGPVMERYDAVLLGGGIMSATLGTLLAELEPSWKILVVERLSDVGQESSNAWNNAGTGHSALCELNYTPELADGSIAIASAVKVNEQFQISRQFWSWLVESRVVADPTSFIHQSPHMSFVRGEDNVAYLRKRYDALKSHPLFIGMEYTEDPQEIARWAPLLIDGRRKGEPLAATRFVGGSDVDFGSLTTTLLERLQVGGAEVLTNYRVSRLRKRTEGTWRVGLRAEIGETPREVEASFVFVGAGGMSLNILQKSGIPEIRGYGGFPVSGVWLRCDNPEVVALHKAKVYGKASVGAPPMSVPHLDTRVVAGEESLLFGPYAGFTPKFLKNGSWFDLFGSLRWHNVLPMLAVAVQNFSLVSYLVTEVLASRGKRLEALWDFYPSADPDDWYELTAGQRVQVIKPDRKKVGVLQFGTEVVTSADGSIAGLLGASPGASTAAAIMLEVLERCFPERVSKWTPTLTTMVPSYGTELSDDPDQAYRSSSHTASVLKL